MNRARLWSAAILLALLIGAAFVSIALGAVGGPGLVTSYGNEGVARLQPLASSPEASGESAGFNHPYSQALGFAAAPNGSAYVMAQASSCGRLCRNGPYVARFSPAGKPDGGFAGDGRLELPTGANHYTVGADGIGRVLVAYQRGAIIFTRRFEADGTIDPSFGKGGTEVLHCACATGYRQLRWLRAPSGRLFLVIDRLPGRGEGKGSRFEIFRLLADGKPDGSFGRGGKLAYASAHGEIARAVAVAPGGAILIGGNPYSGPRQIFLERIGAGGRPDRRFDRTAAGSVRRLNSLGEFPSLAAVVPRADGGLVAIGSSDGRGGFYLRLRADGRLARSFGRRGLVRLPFLVDSAAAGTAGAIFVVGEPPPYGRYHAYRVLADGKPDPAFNGAGGIVVPLPGVPARVTPIGGGKVLVTNKGDYECVRECEPPEPAIALFHE
jgi:uncharacterized delta-60 repeat protein